MEEPGGGWQQGAPHRPSKQHPVRFNWSWLTSCSRRREVAHNWFSNQRVADPGLRSRAVPPNSGFTLSYQLCCRRESGVKSYDQ